MFRIRITNYIPDDNWRDLQSYTCKFLVEAGYSAETEKTIDTVRGTVEVDVYVTSHFELVKQFVCECKCWNSNVPQEKIHAFRTVVSDSGSMFGIFIVKKGYQTGAIEAAYRTNVLLKTWDEFIDLISKQWIIRQVLKIKKIAAPLAVFIDPLDVPFDELSDIDVVKYRNLIAICIKQFSTIRTLELSSLEKDFIEFDGHQFTALDELLSYAEDFFKIIIEEFEMLFKHTHIDRDAISSWEHMLIPINFEDNKSLLIEAFNGFF